MEPNNKVHAIEAGPTDVQKAEALRDALMPVLRRAAEIMDHARASGLNVTFSVAPDSFGRMQPTITVVKPIL